MSRANFLEKLLDGVEVEWKPLGEVAHKISSGGTPKTGVSEYYDGDIPWLRTQEINFCDIWDTGIKITIDGLKNSSANLIPANCVIVAMYGATVGKIGINKIPMATNQACANIELDEHIANYRYVFHYLCSQYEYIKSLGTGSQTNINAGIVKKLPVPIPCPENPKKSLEIQAEIVRILDAFTAQTAELAAELAARQKQYAHYRDQLLSFEDGEVEWKTLDDVFNIFVGGDVPKEALSGTETEEFCIPVLSNGIGDKAIYGWTNKPKINEPSLTISARGTIGWTSYRHKPFFPIVRLLVLTQKIQLNMKYAYYFMKSIENNYKIPEAGIPQLTKPMIKDIQIPIPFPNDSKKSLAEQARIVAILDKFEALTNSISEGLPREIELRQKQYEYYRDMLFNFPKPQEVE